MLDALNGIYCGPQPAPGALLMRWNLDPLLLAALVALAWHLRRSRSGVAAVAVLSVALVSPLCALSSALFAARAVHHVLLVAVAAPLLAAAGRPGRVRSPGLAFAGATAVLWAWHLPAAYDLALSNVAAYWAMQASLLASAWLFWRSVLAGDGAPVSGVLFATAGAIQMTLLGALLTFAPLPLYAVHAAAPFAWGLSPLADQQLGGLIMWVPGAMPYAIAGAILARRAWTTAKAAA